MTLYPSPLTRRFTQALGSLQQRVTKLESRTAGIDSGFPLMLLPGQIDPAWDGTGEPQVYVNGSATLSGPFPYLSWYTPVAGDDVLLAPVGALQQYVIAGKYTGTITPGGAGTTVTYSQTAPPDPKTGDVWYQTDAGNNVIQVNVWSGTEWVIYETNAQVLTAGTVTATQIAAQAVGTAQLANSAVTSGQLAAGAVTQAAIAAGAVGTSQIADSAITSALIAAGAVGAGAIASGAITATQIAAAAGILGSQLADGTVTAAQIEAGTITAALLAAGIVVAGVVDGTTIEGATLIASGGGTVSAEMVSNALRFLGVGSTTVTFLSAQAAASNSTRPQANLSGPSNNDGVPQILLVGESQDGTSPQSLILQGFSLSGNTGSAVTVQVNGTLAATHPGSVSTAAPSGTPETPQTGAGLNSFTLNPSGFQRFQYWLSANNTVEVAGCVQTPATFSGSSPFFQLPSGYRPNAVVQWSYTVQQGVTITGVGTGAVQVDASGNMTLRNNPAPISSGTSAVVYVQGRFALGTV